MCASQDDSSDYRWRSRYTSQNKDLYFLDGKRRIDFVLVYSLTGDTEENVIKRKAFLRGLRKNNLEYEVEDCFGSVRESHKIESENEDVVDHIIQKTEAATVSTLPKHTQRNTLGVELRRGSIYRPSQASCSAPPTSMQRYIQRAEADTDEFLGLDDLVFVKLYVPWNTMCSYAELFKFRKPLRITNQHLNDGESLLQTNRASLLERDACGSSRCCSMEPMGIKPLETTFTWPFNQRRQYLFYFGEATAFYFAWLGFYTTSLLPVAILGLLVFFFGILGMTRSSIVKDVCDHGSNTTMCPLCSSERCQFWSLNSSCLRTKLTHMVDNEGTVLFGVIMALWAVLFLEMWKRTQISLAYRWDVYDLEPIDQPARPEFLALLEKGYPTRRNPISENEEPIVPFWRKRIPFILLSFSTVMFAVVLTLAFLVGIILYKLVMRGVFYRQPSSLVQSNAGIIATMTGSVINLIVIVIMKYIYDRVSVRMTDLECHRTQIEYDNSLTLKLYLLQFVNYYSSIFYIAFIQGTTAALPGSKHVIVQSTGCDQGDCLFDLFLQLVVIMVGKQILSFLQETLMPVFLRLAMKMRHQRRRKKLGTVDSLNSAEECKSSTVQDHLLACRADYTLLDSGSRPLFNEYLEMMIQFGFITMFVPAFPLAPLFGLLNNIIEIRGDAQKFVNQYRRPVLKRVKTIGMWYTILLVLSSIAIRTNACIIAFTTQFIDRSVYRFHYSENQSLQGFKNFTMSQMLSSRFDAPPLTQYCRYNDYRKPPWEDSEMSRTRIFYHVLAAKFIFVFMFETITILLTAAISAIIPDVPERIKTKIYYEANETNRIIQHAEKIDRKTRRRSSPSNLTRNEMNQDMTNRMNLAMHEEFPSALIAPFNLNSDLGFSTPAMQDAPLVFAQPRQQFEDRRYLAAGYHQTQMTFNQSFSRQY